MDEPSPTPIAPAVTGRMTQTVDLPPVAAEAAKVSAAAGVDAAVLSTSGQRRVNLLWEITQLVIAISVTDRPWGSGSVGPSSSYNPGSSALTLP